MMLMRKFLISEDKPIDNNNSVALSMNIKKK